MMKKILRPYVAMADMLVKTFGSDCEVVLHDLDMPEHSVVYVAGNVTGRRVGDSFDRLVRQVILSDALQENYAANYYFSALDGRQIRSSTLLIKDEEGRLEGALCINLDTSKVTSQIQWLQSFLPGLSDQGLSDPAKSTLPGSISLPGSSGAPSASDTGQNAEENPAPEHVADMIENLMDRIIGSDRPETELPAEGMTREERIEKVRFMEAKGIFLMKGSVELAAEKLGVGKVTIYSYLDEVRGKRSPSRRSEM